MKTFAPHQLDFYKVGHQDQYPENTEYVYANLTARSGRLSNVPNSKGVVLVGIQLLVKDYLIDCWNETFFSVPKIDAIEKYRRRTSVALGYDVSTERLEALHDLGYLPIKLKALAEGSFVPYKVPVLTIVNTLPGYFWLSTGLESIISNYLWQMITSATTYREYRRVFIQYAEETCDSTDHVPFQAHDFSFRGLTGPEPAARSAFAALAAGSEGTDSVAGLDIAEDYYGATGFIAGSIPATEHSVMCAGTKEGEQETYRRLLEDIYPTGPLAIVSDTWDFWKVVTETLPNLKELILARDGKLIIRPDSGDPVDIVCGIKTYNLYDECAGELGTAWNNGFRAVRFMGVILKLETYREGGELRVRKGKEISKAEEKGLVECLWDTFGGTINSKGYKILDSHIGAIYGDSITLARQREILERLKAKGFASDNITLGVGSYTYQMVTRDTHGMAMKATSVTVDGERRDIFKDPKTDDGTKKSAKGLLMVTKIGRDFELRDQVTELEESRGALEVVFLNGKLVKETTLAEIRDIALEVSY